MLVGLSGSHRTGKTTLGREFAKQSYYEFVAVNTSEMQKQIGFDSSNQSYDLETRILIQEHLFSCYQKLLKNYKATDNVIFDRTPLDLATYAIMAVDETATLEQAKWLERYIQRCKKLCKKHFSLILILQPAIKPVDCETSAKANLACMIKYNAIMMGLNSLGESLSGLVYKVPKEEKSLKGRIETLEEMIASKKKSLAIKAKGFH